MKYENTKENVMSVLRDVAPETEIHPSSDLYSMLIR